MDVAYTLIGVGIALGAALLLWRAYDNARWNSLPVITHQAEPELRYVRFVEPTAEQLQANQERRQKVQQWRENVLAELQDTETDWPHPEANEEAS